MEDSFINWYSSEFPNEMYLDGLEDWEERTAVLERLEASGRITGWGTGWYLRLGSSDRLTIIASICRTSIGCEFASSPHNPFRWSSLPEYMTLELLRDLEIGGDAVFYRLSIQLQTGEMRDSYSIAFSFRNTGIQINLFTNDEPASEDQLDLLVEIAQLQYAKLQSMPLSDEFVGYW